MSGPERLTDRDPLLAEEASENLIFYVVDKDNTTEHPEGSSFQVSKEVLIEILLSGTSINQNNINIVKGFQTPSSNFLDMVAAIDNLTPYTINEQQTVFFQTSILDPNDVLNTAIITLATRDVGKGTYGAGETSLFGKLWIVGTRRLAYGDAEDLPNTQIINLGAHTSTTVEAVFNAESEFTVQNTEAGLRLVNITLDSEEKQFFFTGPGGDYGVGGDLTATSAQFDEITGNEPVEPIIPTEEQISGTTIELNQTNAVSDVITLDLATFSSCKIHIDSADIELDDTTNRPASGKSFTKYYELSTENGTEAYTLPAAWKLFGELDASAVNYIAVEYSNFTTAGMRIKAYINQETV